MNDHLMGKSCSVILANVLTVYNLNLEFPIFVLKAIVSISSLCLYFHSSYFLMTKLILISASSVVDLEPAGGIIIGGRGRLCHK